MVAGREPKTREAAEGFSPSASAESTWATCWEGVFSRYNGVLRRARERGTAGLTPKRLDPLETAMLAVADQSVDVSVSVPEVRALGVGTGVAVGVHALGRSPAAF